MQAAHQERLHPLELPHAAHVIARKPLIDQFKQRLDGGLERHQPARGIRLFRRKDAGSRWPTMLVRPPGDLGRFRRRRIFPVSSTHRTGLCFLRHVNKRPSRDQEAFTWAAVARKCQREVDGTRQKPKVF